MPVPARSLCQGGATEGPTLIFALLHWAGYRDKRVLRDYGKQGSAWGSLASSPVLVVVALHEAYEFAARYEHASVDLKVSDFSALQEVPQRLTRAETRGHDLLDGVEMLSSSEVAEFSVLA